MRIVTVQTDDGERVGVLNDADEVVLLPAAEFPSALALIEGGAAMWAVAASLASDVPDAPLADVRLAAPVPRPPRNAFCVGLNYRTHWDEGQRPQDTNVPTTPVFFTKPWTSLTGHRSTVEIDTEATAKVDWEAEIAVVIGRGGRNIAEEEALDHVFGYALANDVSARDLQLDQGPMSQWFKGKSLDGFCPMGPWIRTVDEVPDPTLIEVRLEVNGHEKQSFCAADMIHTIPALIRRLSLGMALLPGDVIVTGTASGVGHWREPPEFLTDGDTVTMTSNLLGELSFSMALAGASVDASAGARGGAVR